MAFGAIFLFNFFFQFTSLRRGGQQGIVLVACVCLFVCLFIAVLGLLETGYSDRHKTINPLDSKGNYSATSNNTNGTLAVDGWAVTFDTAMRGLGWAAARPGPSSLYQM